MNTVNKSQLVDALASATGEAKGTVEKVLGSFMDMIGTTLKKGDRVALTGFGTFEPRQRPARTGRNPQTGQSIKIKASTVPAFKAGSGLKEAVSGAKKATGKKAGGGVKKATAKKATAKKATAKKAAAKATAKKATAKATAKKATAKKAAKKAAAKKAAKKA